MGIASGVFWIMFGLIYILYQAFKEHPGETFAGAVMFVCIIGAIGVFYLGTNLLMKVSPWLSVLWVICSVGALIYWAYKVNAKEKEKQAKRSIEYSVLQRETKRIIDAEKYSNEEIDEYAKKWCRMYSNIYRPERTMYMVASTYDEKAKARIPIIEDYRRNVRFPFVMDELRKKLEADKASGRIDEAWYESSGDGWGEEVTHTGG